jgi:hypothetical protein
MFQQPHSLDSLKEHSITPSAPLPDLREVESKMKKLRAIHFLLIFFVLVAGFLTEPSLNRASNPWKSPHWLASGLALVTIIEGFFFRHRSMTRFERAVNRGDQRVLKHWEAGQLVPQAMAASVGTWGMVIRTVLGGTRWQALCFYCVSVFLLLLWTPRRPSADTLTLILDRGTRKS